MFNDNDCSGHLSSDHLLNTRSVSLTGVFISLRIDLIWIVWMLLWFILWTILWLVDTVVQHGMVHLKELSGMSKVTPKHDVLLKPTSSRHCVYIVNALAFEA